MMWLQWRSPRTRVFCTAGLLAGLLLVAASWRSVFVWWQIREARSELRFGGPEEVKTALETLGKAEGVERSVSPELLFLLGRAHRRAGNIEEAFDYLSSAKEAGWPSAEVDRQVELALIQRGRFEGPGVSFNRLLAPNTSDETAYEIYEAIAKGYLYAYRFNDALHCLNFWIDWQPGSVEPRLMRAGIWDQLRSWEQANNEYREVLAIDPSNRKARLALAGNLLLKLNRAADAEQEFKRGLKHNPDDVNALLGLASCARQLGEPQRAEEFLRGVLERQLSTEQLASARLELGQLLLDGGKLDEAHSLLRKVIEDDPLNSTAHYSMGVVHARRGQSERAADCFERSRELQQQFTRLTDITTELVSQPDNAELRWEAGSILMNQGMYREGAAWMSTALMYDPGHRKTHESLAWYYETVKPDRRLAENHRIKAQRHSVESALN